MQQRKIIIKKWITRDDLRNNPDKVYLFGDNLMRKGMGGQAKEMRDEPNAVGIATKMSPYSYMTDETYDFNVSSFQTDFNKIPEDKDIVIPADGLGTGLAMLDKMAPKSFEYLQNYIESLKNLAITIEYED